MEGFPRKGWPAAVCLSQRLSVATGGKGTGEGPGAPVLLGLGLGWWQETGRARCWQGAGSPSPWPVLKI